MDKIAANILQNAPNCTIFKNFSVEHVPEPPNKRVAKYPHFSKIYLTPPPPPRNEILDKPHDVGLLYIMYILSKLFFLVFPHNVLSLCVYLL